MPDPSPREPAPILDAEVVPADPATPPPAVPAPDYDEHGTPSFDYVRDRIERRAATADGARELQPDTKDVDEQLADRDRKAAEKLAELRRSLGPT